MAAPPVRRSGMRYLLPTEVPVVFVRRHPIVLLRYLIEVVVAGLVCGTIARGLSPENDDVVWWLFLLVVARAIWMAMEWHNDRFLVTDRRIMLVSGLLTRKVAMMPLIKVTDLTFERPLVGRFLGYGTFVLESAGQDQALRRIGYLPAPDVLYRDVSQLIFGPGKIAAPPATRPGAEED